MDGERCERVVVIGGGLTGTITALQLAMRSYSVVILEREALILAGSALIPARLHLGGEYPMDKSMETGFACMRTAVIFRQMLPECVLGGQSSQECLFASAHASAEILSASEIRSFYGKLQAYYAQLCRAHPENRVFGCEDELVRDSEEEDLGGVVARELGINPARLGCFLELALQHFKITIKTDAEVTDVTKESEACFKVTFLNKEKEQDIVFCSSVVNTANESGFYLEKTYRTGLCRERTELRGMALVDCSDMSQRQMTKRPCFVFEGTNGGMWHPFNDSYAFVYWPATGAAYWEDTSLNEWREWMHAPCGDVLRLKRDRLNTQMQAQQSKLFPFLAQCRPVNMILRLVVHTDQQPKEDVVAARRRRPYSGIKCLTPGFWALRTEKATYAPALALQVLVAVQRYSVDVKKRRNFVDAFPCDNKSNLNQAPVPPIHPSCKLQGIVKCENFDAMAEDFATQRGFPTGFSRW